MSSLDEFYAGGPKTWNEAFPPICLRTHWDPTALSKHVLPTTDRIELPLDPRQATKICYGYYHTSFGDPQSKTYEDDKQPEIPTALLGGQYMTPVPTRSSVLPPGGAASLGFPYSAFQNNVSAESDLQLLRLPLTKCSERKYMPPNKTPPSNIDTNIVPGANNTTLSPLATVVAKQVGCRGQDDEAAWNRSSRLFYNPTKYDRTTSVPQNLKIAESNNSLRC
jgi:hypothetical protein